MKFKKAQAIIIIFAILWVIFIGWGVVRTTVRRLSKKGFSAKETASGQARPSADPSLPIKEPSENVKARPVLVRTLRATPIDFSDLLPVMGTIKGSTEIELRFEINGIIKSIYFREGAKIKKGDLVACLDSKDAQLKLNYAKNKLASMQAAYQANLKKVDIHQKLYEAGVIIKSRLEEVMLESESAKFQVETVRAEKDLAE
ncbi:MAG: biotin/lipoyl-binding protein, partial [Candidatus Omnitrophota bacterium]|nr:biotin/lipoyl-binding protein [Candidatus Omnitrophota bacterium]